MNPTPHPAEERILYRLAQAERAMHTRLDQDLQPLGLSITGYSVLWLLAHKPNISASEIARRTLISQQAASRLIDRLISLRLVVRRAKRGRAQELENSALGLKKLALADPIVDLWEQKLRHEFGAPSAKRFDAQLLRFIALFQPHPTPPESPASRTDTASNRRSRPSR